MKSRFLLPSILIGSLVLIAGCTMYRERESTRMNVSIVNQQHEIFTKESNDTWYRLTCEAINHGDPGYVSIRAEADDNLGRSLGKSEDKRVHLDTNESMSLIFEFDIDDTLYEEEKVLAYVWAGDWLPD